MENERQYFKDDDNFYHSCRDIFARIKTMWRKQNLESALGNHAFFRDNKAVIKRKKSRTLLCILLCLE